MQISINKKKTILITSSVACFIWALSNNAFCLANKCDNSAFLAFLLGALGIGIEMVQFFINLTEHLSGKTNSDVFYYGASLTWIANPMLFFSYFLINKKLLRSIYFSVGSLVIMLCFMMFSRLFHSSTGKYATITGLNQGYYFWVLSAAIMAIGSILIFLVSSKTEKDLSTKKTTHENKEQHTSE